jgi:hypothetical protein
MANVKCQTKFIIKLLCQGQKGELSPYYKLQKQVSKPRLSQHRTTTANVNKLTESSVTMTSNLRTWAM